jgi:hypothetical protein
MARAPGIGRRKAGGDFLVAPCRTLGAVSQGRVLVKDHSLDERSLQRAMKDYIAHYHTERNHQGKNNLPLFQRINKTDHDKPVRCRDRLGGLLRYYHQEAA